MASPPVTFALLALAILGHRTQSQTASPKIKVNFIPKLQNCYRNNELLISHQVNYNVKITRPSAASRIESLLMSLWMTPNSNEQKLDQSWF
jgi:hypothetical protein